MSGDGHWALPKRARVGRPGCCRTERIESLGARRSSTQVGPGASFGSCGEGAVQSRFQADLGRCAMEQGWRWAVRAPRQRGELTTTRRRSWLFRVGGKASSWEPCRRQADSLRAGGYRKPSADVSASYARGASSSNGLGPRVRRVRRGWREIATGEAHGGGVGWRELAKGGDIQRQQEPAGGSSAQCRGGQ